VPTRVVVAGAGGYVGGRLVAELLGRDGVEVLAVVQKPRPWLGAVEQVAVDLRRPSAALDEAVDGADALVHLAGPSEVVAASDPAGVLADTVAITTELGAAAARAGVGRVVYLSTIHVYGARAEPGATLTEDLRPEPRHPYAIARLASEHALRALGLDPVCLRLTNSVGAPADVEVDRWSLVVNDLCRQAATTGTLRLRTDGMQWRDFVALADATRIIAAIALGAGTPGTWNLGSGRASTVRHAAELVADAVEARTGRRPPLEAPEPPAAPPGPHDVDVAGLAAQGLVATTPLAVAVDEVAAFCLDHASELAAGADDGGVEVRTR
jgi:UDP-glucose 4-epimerase